MVVIIFIILLSLVIVSYFFQRYIMKLSNRDIWEILKFDLKINGISETIKIVSGISLLLGVLIFGPVALILLALYIIILMIR